MAGIQWEKDFDVAVEKGKNAGKPIFQDFWFDGCIGCAQMNAGPYTDKKVQRFLEERFIPVRSECFWENPTPLMEKYAIKWTPTFLVHGPGGKEHHRFVGFVPVDDLFAHLGLGVGKIFYDSDRLEDAIRQFQTVIERHPDAGPTPEAVFLRGVAEYKHTDDAKALRRAYELLKAEYPETEWARRAAPYSAIPL